MPVTYAYAGNGYSNANQVSAITHRQANGTLIGNLTYTYDAAGRRISAGGTLAAVELPAQVTDTQYDANNRLTRWAGVAYSYDANGNLMNDGQRTYVWDARNQLQGIGGAAVASFIYDPFGRRIGKTVTGISTGFLYDGANFVQELAGAGSASPVRANVLTGSIDETFTRMSGTGSAAVLSHFLPDANNNTIALTDSTQTIATGYRYTPYGETIQTGAANGNSQQYTGRENDGTGLMYYRARYYLPGCGRFISEDPIGWASGQTNNYAYVGGDPVSRVDPSGEAVMLIFPIAGAIIGAVQNMSRAAAQCQSGWGIAWAGVVGAATGAASTLPVTGIGLRAAAATNAAASLANDHLTGNAMTDPMGSLQSAALAAAGGALGASQAARAIDRTLQSNPIRRSDFHDPATLDALRRQASEANTVWQQVPTVLGGPLGGGGPSTCR